MEPIAISKEKQIPPAQARSPTLKRRALEGKEGVRAGKGTDSSRLMELLEDVEKDLKTAHNVKLRFSVHEASDRIMVTVIDESTGEVIREIPSSEVLNLSARLEEMVGLIFDQKG